MPIRSSNRSFGQVENPAALGESLRPTRHSWLVSCWAASVLANSTVWGPLPLTIPKELVFEAH